MCVCENIYIYVCVCLTLGSTLPQNDHPKTQKQEPQNAARLATLLEGKEIPVLSRSLRLYFKHYFKPVYYYFVTHRFLSGQPLLCCIMLDLRLGVEPENQTLGPSLGHW